jgi:hypothetical protein
LIIVELSGVEILSLADSPAAPRRTAVVTLLVAAPAGNVARPAA